ncbi:MAG: DUF2256 domain-containing protein [Pseudomonadota bacterium]
MKGRKKYVKKAHLPVNICATCGRPFAWRRKWALVWDQVRYCSDRCRKRRRRPPAEHDRGPKPQ